MSDRITKYIINAEDETNKLKFIAADFIKILDAFTNDYQILLIGAVGKMRVGKSSALNNFLEMMTKKSKKFRPFSEIEAAVTNTRGIHAFPISWEEITDDYKKIILSTYAHPINILLMDCEGTESSNSVATSRLYLINMLITSVVHIHVAKAIDQAFASKLSQATISSRELITQINEDMLPALHILIKDTTTKAWENSKKDKSLDKYEDLLKEFPELYNYYNLFPSKNVEIIPPPKIDDELGILVDDRNSNYWKKLELVLSKSFAPKLKSKEAIVSLINSLVKNINEENLMNVKTELDAFYDHLFKNQKSELIQKILERSIQKFGDFEFTKQKMGEEIKLITKEEIVAFEKRVDNVSCKFIYTKMKEQIDYQIKEIILLLEKEYDTKKNEYLFQRESTKEINAKFEEKERDVVSVDTKNSGNNHETWVEMYSCCFSTDKNNEGCQSYSRSQSTFVFPLVFTSSTVTGMKHPGSWIKACPKCKKNTGSCIGGSNITTKKEKYKEFTGIDQKYIMDNWNDNNFKANALETINQLLLKNQNNKN